MVCSGQEVAALLTAPIRKSMNSLTVKPPPVRKLMNSLPVQPPPMRKSKISLLLSLPRDGSRCFGAASGKTPGPQFAQTITKSFTEPSRNLHGLQQSFLRIICPSLPPCMSSLSEPPLLRKSKNSLLLSLLRDGSRLLGRGCGGELRASM